jgi:hypothetical protein
MTERSALAKEIARSVMPFLAAAMVIGAVIGGVLVFFFMRALG